MNRRKLLKSSGLLAAGAIIAGNKITAAAKKTDDTKKSILKIAHITDVHIRPEYNAIERFKKCLNRIRKEKVDFILNGGDSIFAADYDDIKKERVLELWKCWNESIEVVKGFEIYIVLCNHDMWWQGKGDALYGKPGVMKMLGMTNNYYSFDKGGWHFIMLDSNHSKTPGMLDDEQWKWFADDVGKNTEKPILIMSHYPLLSCTGIIDNKADFIGPFSVSGGYNHLDIMKFIDVFNQNPNVKLCLSGHIHLRDKVWYNGVNYLCNGAVSGYWWGSGDDGKGSYKQTSPGYSILNLYKDGSFDDEYIQFEA
ncbi:MAG: metallophosphoesterase family protein [Ginsengibacter sp.]